jgi:hypothetical protein
MNIKSSFKLKANPDNSSMIDSAYYTILFAGIRQPANYLRAILIIWVMLVIKPNPMTIPAAIKPVDCSKLKGQTTHPA